MAMGHKVRIKLSGVPSRTDYVEIDGLKLQRVIRVEVAGGVNELPQVTVSFYPSEVEVEEDKP